jgi:hypothetical protein
MALTNVQALGVVVGCVNGVSGQSPSPNQTLKQGGITDSGRLGAFKSAVVTDTQRGVKNCGHEIVSSALAAVAVDDSVQATADVVRANATPIPAGNLLSAEPGSAAGSARRGAKPGTRPAAKRGAGTRRAKKTAPKKRKATRRPRARKQGTKQR